MVIMVEGRAEESLCHICRYLARTREPVTDPSVVQKISGLAHFY